MKSIKIFIAVLYILALCGCSATKNKLNHFTSSNDTLLIRSQKHKGAGLFTIGAMSPEFINPDDTIFKNTAILPKELVNISRLQVPVDFRQEKREHVDILKGTKNGHEVFIIDTNKNYDFSDDTIYNIKQLNWYSDENTVKHKFLISNGSKIVKDSSWIDLGTDRGNLFYRKNEHLTASFSIGKNNYKIGIADSRNPLTFTYSERAEIALLNDNGQIKDTLLLKDKIVLGEFVKLGRNYYKVEKLSNNGEYLTLIKDDNFEQKTGLQVGMNAPAFKGVSVNGIEINSVNMHNKTSIVINSCGCGGDKASAQAYYDILQKYGGKINVIRLDSKLEKGLNGIQIDVDEEANKEFYSAYRGEYCSRICYVIDHNNKIIDKFDGEDWQSFPIKI